MAWIERGRIHEGAIVFPQPLPIPDGTVVEVRIDPITSAVEPAAEPARDEDFTHLDVFGMWADRPEKADSTEWVRKQRSKWQQRISRRD